MIGTSRAPRRACLLCLLAGACGDDPGGVTSSGATTAQSTTTTTTDPTPTTSDATSAPTGSISDSATSSTSTTTAPSTSTTAPSTTSTTSTSTTGDPSTTSTSTTTDTTTGDASTGSELCPALVLPAGPTCPDPPTEVTTLATFMDPPYPLAVDDDDVFFAVSVFTDEVHRVSKCGGPTTKLADAGANPAHMVVDQTAVYWTDYVEAGSVFKVAKAGGPRVALATPETYPLPLRADGDRVCWGSGFVADIRCVPLGGGVVTAIPTAPHAVVDLRPFENQFYWTSQTMGVVGRVDEDGADLQILVDTPNPGSLLVDCTHVYFTDQFGDLQRIPLLGGPPEEFATSVHRLAQSDDTVFWTDYNNGFVRARDKLGGPVEDLGAGLGNPHLIAVDATHVYWTDTATNTVMAAPR